MERGEIQTALESSVEEVLETMFFSTVLASAEGLPPGEPEQSGNPGGRDRNLTAELGFEGDIAGRFRVGVSSNLCRVMAACFLGCEETDIADSQAAEVICELASIVCGSVLSRLGRTEAFGLSHPEIVDSRGAAIPDVRRWFSVEDGFLTASVKLEALV